MFIRFSLMRSLINLRLHFGCFLMMGTSRKLFLLTVIAVFVVSSPISAIEYKQFRFGNFGESNNQDFNTTGDSSINKDALQLTPDTMNTNFALVNKSGRVMLKQKFKLWERENEGSSIRASFNSTFNFNIFRPKNETPGEGLTFIIAPDVNTPVGSFGQWLGISNRTIDGNVSNQIIAIEFDTFKNDFDPDDNHIGLDINSVKSNVSVSLSDLNITLSPNDTVIYTVWIQYDGKTETLSVYIARNGSKKPENPVINNVIDLRTYVAQYSYLGFSGSTGSTYQLNCITEWNLTIEVLPENKQHHWKRIVIPVVVVLVVVIVLVIVCWICYVRRKEQLEQKSLMTSLQRLPGMPRELHYNELKKATDNFNEKKKLGQGGFGTVYMGFLSIDKIEVAVKMFSREDMKGKNDFLAELSIINRLRHKNLVKLIGWCHRNGCLLLVYDYMPNGSLDRHLFTTERTLNWERRSKIISDIASALHYLHNEYDQRVIHRDLKASNVLLDADFNARLGDFGLARAIDNEKTSYSEAEGVPGTFGYLAPECLHTGKATTESDVYGFGALVLEVVCGRRPICDIDGFQLLVNWVWTLYREDRILDAVDQNLAGDFVKEEAELLLKVGLICSHPIAKERLNMKEVVKILSKSMEIPYIPPIKPAFVWTGEDGYSIGMGIRTPITSSFYGSEWSKTFSG